MPHLTVESIRRRKAGPARIEIADSACRGLYLRIEPNGRKAWFLRYLYQEPGGAKSTNRKHLLGTFGDGGHELSLDRARAEAATWRTRMRDGQYPHLVTERDRAAASAERERQAAAPTMAKLLTEFRDKYLAVMTKRPDDRLTTANKWIDAELLATPVADVRRRDLNRLLDTIVEAGHPVAANGLARLLGQMFRWAVDAEWIEASPAERLQKGSSHTPRDRVLSDGEVKIVWDCLDRTDIAMSTAVRQALRVMLLTGVRAGEIAAARWEQVLLDGKEPLWTIPAIAAKSARAHLVPLSKQAVKELWALQALTGETPFLLPAAERVRGPERLGKRDVQPDSHMEAHALGVAVRRLFTDRPKKPKALTIPAFTPHDLRRTLRTGLSKLGFSVDLCEKVIGHAVRNQLIATYDLYDAMPERREALEAWGREVQKLTSSKRRSSR